MEDILERIKEFADRAHGDQQRKYSPERYIAHPVRVMELCRQYSPDLPVLAAALLHDVLEDTQVTAAEITSFLEKELGSQQAQKTVKLVLELTDIYTKQQYPGWNRRRRKNREAERIKSISADSQTVKYADIIDNCREIVECDPKFAAVFIRECRNLLKVMPKGNPHLYLQARQTVDECLMKLKTRALKSDE